MHSRKSAQADSIQQSSYLFKDKTFFAGEMPQKRGKTDGLTLWYYSGGCFYVVPTMRICAIERIHLMKPQKSFQIQGLDILFKWPIR